MRVISLKSYIIISATTLLLSMVACVDKKNIEPHTLHVDGNSADRIWALKADGDTLVLNVVTDSPMKDLHVNNVSPWINVKLDHKKLYIYVLPNRGANSRVTAINLQSIYRGTILAGDQVRLKQASNLLDVKEKALFTYSPDVTLDDGLNAFNSANKTLKTFVSVASGSTDFNNIFYSTMTPDELNYDIEYDDTSNGWINKVDMLTNETGFVTGLKLSYQGLPSDIKERTANIILKDKLFPNLKASIKCIQTSVVLGTKNTLNKIILLTDKPYHLDIPLKTNIPLDKIKVGYYLLPFMRASFEQSYESLDKQMMNPIYQYNYMEKESILPNISQHIHIEQRPDGPHLIGVISSYSADLKPLSYTYFIRRRFMIILETEHSNKKLFIPTTLNEYEDFKTIDNYVSLAPGYENRVYTVPQEGADIIDVEFRGNVTPNAITPEWMNLDNEWGDPAMALVTYPDVIKLIKPIHVYPNPYRAIRKGAVTFNLKGNIGIDDTSNDATMKPLGEIYMKQAGFTGDYSFDFNHSAVDLSQPIHMDSNGGTFVLPLETNNGPDDIIIDKTANSGFIDYAINTDKDTQIAKTIVFTIDPMSDDDKDQREVTLTIRGLETSPKGTQSDVRKDLVVKIIQSK